MPGTNLNGIGIGLRHPHLQQVREEKPAIPWVEVHAENFFALESPERAGLLAVRTRYPVSLHAVGLSLGGPALDGDHLAQLHALVEEVQPVLVSDHLAWCREEGGYLPDLLPMAYNRETFTRTAAHISRVQDRLRRTILIENPSAYLQFRGEYSEAAFLAELANTTGCGILLDVNNLYVAKVNLGVDPLAYLDELPVERVGEIHLAGHTERNGFLIDTHAGTVSDAVLSLYREARRRFPQAPALLEWDNDLPPLSALLAERLRLEATHSLTVDGQPGEQPLADIKMMGRCA